MSSEKLMVSLAGHPFINVRNSFNSLIPAGLSKKIEERLINYYLQKLNKSPFLHDKVEFDILFSCYTPKTEIDLCKLEKEGFSKKEIQTLSKDLKILTINILENPNLSIQKQLNKVQILDEK